MGKIEQAKDNYLKLISINSMDVKSYYGLFTLNIKNITDELYKSLESIIKINKISIYEKSLINFIFSKIEKERNKLHHKDISEFNIN